jgi:hypothetical protein
MAGIAVRVYRYRTVFRVRMRFNKFPVFDLTFSSKEEALKWIEEHEDSYKDNPELYVNWVQANRKSMKEKGIFHVHIPLKT